MKTIDASELKRIQIDILDCFDAFCKKNGIHYWIDYGTLLGAIRHKGYIPWDDDIDIGMLREDYHKAEKLFNEQSDGVILLQTPGIYKDHRYPFGKLVKTDTILYEYGEEGIQSSVYVDVFPYDNAPEDERIRKKIFKKRDFLGRIRRIQLPLRAGVSQSKKRLYGILSAVMKIVPKGFINRALDRNARRFSRTDSKYVCSFTDPYEIKYVVVPKKIFQKYIEVEFEGKMYPAPAEYDYWLKKYYGDYMTLPPENERQGHHVFEAYYVE